MRTERLDIRLFLFWLAFGSSGLAQELPDTHQRYLELLRSKGRGEYASALEQAKRLAAEHPELEPVHRTLVDLYESLDEVDEGVAYVQRAMQEPYSLYCLGRFAFHRGDLDGAIDWYQRALAVDPDFAEAVGLHHGLPRVYESEHDLGASIDYFRRLTEAHPESASAWSGLGWSYARSFQFDEAIPAFARALDNESDHVQTLHGLVQAYSRMGQFKKSSESCDALARAATRAGDYEMVVYARMMRGTLAYRRGDYRSALGQLHEARSLAKEIGDTLREATIVNNTAVVYATAGDYEKALPYFEISLESSKRNGSPSANALLNMGTIHRYLGRYPRAIASYRQAAGIAREAGQLGDLALALANMAEAYRMRGDIDTAVRYFREALSLAEETNNAMTEAFVTGLLGGLNRDRGHYQEAIGYFERELAMGRRSGEVQAIWEAQAGLGSTYEKKGETAKAIAHYGEAIARYDSVRQSLAIESIGGSFLDDKYEAYPSIVQLLASEGELEKAFAYAEKYKAKGFLDILARGHTLFENELPEALRRELDDVVDELRQTRAELASRDAPSVALEERVVELELRKASLVDGVRQQYGDFYQLAVSEPLDVTTLQADVLEPGQYLIEYLVGDDTLSIFVVGRDELHYRAVELGREELGRRLTELSTLFEADRAPLLNPQLADFSVPPAKSLYEALLAPVEEWVPRDAELIIVPDDFLFYLPFELLVADSEHAEHRYDFSSVEFVVERYSVSYASSASSLDPSLRRNRRFDKGVLAFGNPASPADGEPPLPNAEDEVEAIGAAFSGYQNGLYTGEQATKAVFAEQAQDYGVLHFATHFSSDDTQPLYSSVALADGDVLQTYEIFDADLNAELAVLSACNTGLGKLAKGEGLIGISRAFLYAGVPSLVVSLWSVNDEATAHIMELFYRHLRAGLSKRQALRQAKLDYLNEASDERRDPFYWAPFVLSGDWHPLDLPPPARHEWRLPASVALLLALAALFVWKRRHASA